MSIAAQPLTTENPALSPWWLRTVLIVMVPGLCRSDRHHFTGLPQRSADPCTGA
jgi:nitric oxide reductase subunit B